MQHTTPRHSCPMTTAVRKGVEVKVYLTMESVDRSEALRRVCESSGWAGYIATPWTPGICCCAADDKHASSVHRCRPPSNHARCAQQSATSVVLLHCLSLVHACVRGHLDCWGGAGTRTLVPVVAVPTSSVDLHHARHLRTATTVATRRCCPCALAVGAVLIPVAVNLGDERWLHAGWSAVRGET